MKAIKQYSLTEARKIYKVVLAAYQQELLTQEQYQTFVSRLGLDYSANPLSEEQKEHIKELENAIQKPKTT